MKRLILLMILFFSLTGCSKNVPAGKTEEDTNVPSAVPTEAAAPTAELEPTAEPEEVLSTEVVQYPVLEKEITESLTDMMYGSFGGYGDEQFTAGWLKYIDYLEVYRNEDNLYNGVLHLNERPLDATARLLLQKYYSDEQLDILCPVLLDVGAAFDLDDINVCLVGELLYQIKTLDDTSVYYYALASLDIPIYDFLSEGFGKSVSDVRKAIKDGQIPGDKAFACLVDYMTYTYEGTFDGLSMEKVKTMSMAALANFDDVRIETLSVVDHENKSINKYKNQKFIDNSSDKGKVSDAEYKTYYSNDFSYDIPSSWNVVDNGEIVCFYPETGFLIFQAFDTGRNDYSFEELLDGFFTGLSNSVSGYTEIATRSVKVNSDIKAKEVIYYINIDDSKYHSIVTVFYYDSVLYSFSYSQPISIKDLAVYWDIIDSISVIY